MISHSQIYSSLPPLSDLSMVTRFRQQNFSQWVLKDTIGYCHTISKWRFFGFVLLHDKVLCIAATASGQFYYSKISLPFLKTAIHCHTQKWRSAEPPLASLLDLAAADPDFFFTLPHAPIPSYLKLWDEEDENDIGLPILVAQLASPFKSSDIQRVVDLNDQFMLAMDREIIRVLWQTRNDVRLHNYFYLLAAPDSESRRQRMQDPLQSPHLRIAYPRDLEF